MSDQKNPLDQALEQAADAFVHAPIGLLFDGPGSYEELVKNGRMQVNTARMMGQFAVQAGQTEVEKRAKELDGPVADFLRGLGVLPKAPKKADPMPAPTPTKATPTAEAPAEPAEKPATPTKATKKAASKKSTTSKKTAKKKAAAKKTSGPSAEGLAIPGYESLSASQVVQRLGGLSEAELLAIEAYEQAKRARKTVLGKIDKLLDR